MVTGDQVQNFMTTCCRLLREGSLPRLFVGGLVGACRRKSFNKNNVDTVVAFLLETVFHPHFHSHEREIRFQIRTWPS